jgi:hypothetical protein
MPSKMFCSTIKIMIIMTGDISGAYTTHAFVCRMGLTSYDQIPENLADYCYVEFTMPATQVSHTTVRSVSLSNGAKDEPPEKYVRYLARHEYRYEHTASILSTYYKCMDHVLTLNLHTWLFYVNLY